MVQFFVNTFIYFENIHQECISIYWNNHIFIILIFFHLCFPYVGITILGLYRIGGVNSKVQKLMNTIFCKYLKWTFVIVHCDPFHLNCCAQKSVSQYSQFCMCTGCHWIEFALLKWVIHLQFIVCISIHFYMLHMSKITNENTFLLMALKFYLLIYIWLVPQVLHSLVP